MDKMRTIFFSMVAVAVVVGASISLTYVGFNNITLLAQPTNNTVTPPAHNNNSSGERDAFTVLPDSSPPTVSDAGLRVEKVMEGLAQPTSMMFIDRDDMLILQKNNGMVRLVSNGVLQE